MTTSVGLAPDERLITYQGSPVIGRTRRGQPLFLVAGGAGDRTIRVRLEAVIGQYRAGLAQAAAQTKAFGGSVLVTAQQNRASFTAMGIAMTAAGALITREFLRAGRAAIEFESTLTKLRTQIGLSESEMRQLGQAALDLRHTGVGAQELAEAAFFVASAGLRGAEALEALEVSAKLSAIGLGETRVVADLVTSAVNAYGSEVLDAAQAGDVLVATVREGKAEAPELAAAMGKVLPIASEMGVSFNEVGGAVAAMTRTGTDAATATTQLRAIMSSLLGPAKQSEEALNSLGLSGAQLRDIIREDGLWAALMMVRDAIGDNDEMLKQVFPNMRALAGFLDLTGANAADNAEIFANMNNVLGLTQEATDLWAQSAEAAQARFSASMEAMRIKVGQVVLPILARLAEFGAGVADAFLGLPGPLQLAAAALGGLTGLGLLFGGMALLVLPRLAGMVEGFRLLTGALAGTQMAASIRNLGLLRAGLAALSTTTFAVGAALVGGVILWQRSQAAMEAARQGVRDLVDEYDSLPDALEAVNRELERFETRHPETGQKVRIRPETGKAKEHEAEHLELLEQRDRIEKEMREERLRALTDEVAAHKLSMGAMADDVGLVSEAYEEMGEDAQEAIDKARAAARELTVSFTHLRESQLGVTDAGEIGTLVDQLEQARTKVRELRQTITEEGDTEGRLERELASAESAVLELEQKLAQAQKGAIDNFREALISNTGLMRQFTDDLVELAARGFEGLAAEFHEMGPSAASAAREAVEMSDRELQDLEDVLTTNIREAKRHADVEFAKYPDNFADQSSAAVDAAEDGMKRLPPALETQVRNALTLVEQRMDAGWSRFKAISGSGIEALEADFGQLHAVVESTTGALVPLFQNAAGEMTAIVEVGGEMRAITFDPLNTNAQTLATMLGIPKGVAAAILLDLQRINGMDVHARVTVDHHTRYSASGAGSADGIEGNVQGTSSGVPEPKPAGTYKRHAGGPVDGGRFFPGRLGPEDVLGLLHRDEFVMQPSATRMLGFPFLEALNRVGEGGGLKQTPSAMGECPLVVVPQPPQFIVPRCDHGPMDVKGFDQLLRHIERLQQRVQDLGGDMRQMRFQIGKDEFAAITGRSLRARARSR